MLRPQQIRSTASHSFICWQCCAKLHTRSLRRAKREIYGGPLSRLALGQETSFSKAARPATIASIRRASTEIRSNTSTELPPPLPIRQRLRQWELENKAPPSRSFRHPNSLKEGDVVNAATTVSEVDFRIEQEATEGDEDASVGEDGLLDVGNRRGFLLPGDLVELRGVLGQPEELAIFIRELDKQSQFYTASGKWINRSSQSAHFFVPNFVEPTELAEVMAILPAADVSSTLRDRLQDTPPNVPRELGKSLIKKMIDFLAKADAIYQAHSTKLDDAHRLVGTSLNYGYASLETISDKLLPTTPLRGDVGKLPSHVLYAVHRSLLRNDMGFRPQAKGTLRTGGEYEISAWKDAVDIHRVRSLVRDHREYQARIASGDPVPRNGPRDEIISFAKAARSVIDLSRRTRPFTSHGTIGRALNKEEHTFEEARTVLDEYGHIVKFIESWAAYSTFINNSFLNGIGSEILRAIGRYEEADRTTAWTFLQEIGHISPWKNRVSFDLRLGTDHPRPIGPSPHDVLEAIRQDWGELPVYCIDDPGAHEIDDGISLEPTEVADEWLCHIHVADPASHLRPGCDHALLAQNMAENVYLPEQVYTIFHSESAKSCFSLDANRPSLTFSARMNSKGHILDTKITAGRIHNVLFLSPTVVEQVTLDIPSAKSPEKFRLVGPEVEKRSSPRPMLGVDDLSELHKAQLQKLHEIGAAHAELLRAKGGVDQNFPSKAKMSVVIPEEPKGIKHSVDPTIKLTMVEDKTDSNASSRSQSNLVQSFMLIAAQVAGMWCKERGIPVPYRVTPRNLAKEDPADFFRREVLPSRAENGMASLDITSEYLRLIGGVQPSSTPGPHAAVGVDMMVRCTSPLRRYTDLIVHWQVGQALLMEKYGKSLAGNTGEDIFVFSKAKIDALLPHLDTREKLIKYGHREAERHWLCHYLLRAWHFGEAELPPTFSFIVKDIDIEKRSGFGMLTELTARAHCSFPEDMDLEKIQIGDKLEVELEDVNVYTRKIQVKALRSSENPKAVG